MITDYSGRGGGRLRWIAAALILLLLFGIAPAAADTGTAVMLSNKDTLLRISNDETARFNDYGNNTYHFFSPTQSASQGLNALHITTDPSSFSGQVTFSTDQSGVFYLTDTGGRGWDDDGILMLAVNGTIPDDFQLHITASGYQWEPVLTGTYPAFADVTYVADALDETFTKDDFLYGPQIWRPCPATDYPIFDGQDMTNTGNNFSIMFIDLKAGILGAGTLSQSDFSGQSINDNGAIRVEYSFENLETFAAFDAYAYTVSSNQGQGVCWTNRLSADGASGYAVTSAPASAAPVADFTAMPTSGEVPLTVEFTDLSANSPTAWSWDFGDNETSTEQNPVHVYTTADTYTVTLTASNIDGSDSAAKTDCITVSGGGPVTTDVSSITVTPSSASMTVGDGAQFVATAYDAGNNTVPGVSFTWTSSDTSVGTVNATGYFTSLTYGRVDVTAAVGAVNGTSSVTVNPTSPVTWSVNASGGGDFTTIQAAIAAAFDGDTIVVGDGTYNETLTIAKPLTLRSANGPEKTEIVSTSKYAVTVSANETTVSGFGLSGSGTCSIYCRRGTSMYTSGCNFTDNIISGEKIGIFVEFAHNALVDGNVITGSISYALFPSSVSDSVISNNTCCDSEQGLHIGSSSNLTVTGNVLTGNNGYGLFLAGIENSRLDHNIIMDNPVGIWMQTGPSNMLFANSIVNNSKALDCPSGQPNIWNSPDPVTYTYNGATYTDYIGNYWGATYPIDDADGNGIGDAGIALCTNNADNYPLVLPAGAYFGESCDGIPIPATVDVSPSSVVLLGETTQQFTGTVYDQNGKVMTGIGFVWGSSNETVGPITSGGLFTAVHAGTTTITARPYLIKGTAEAVVNKTVLETVWTDPCESTDGWTLSNAGLQDGVVYEGSHSIGAPAFAGDAYAERTVVFPDAAVQFRFRAVRDCAQNGVGSYSWLKAFIDNETVATMPVGQYESEWYTYAINITGYETGDHTFRIESHFDPGIFSGRAIGFYVDQLEVRIDPDVAPAVLLGDANDDGVVNQADTLRVLKQIVGLSSKPAVDTELFTKTDVHQNGMIEVGDALYIAQYNVGLRDAWFALKG